MIPVAAELDEERESTEYGDLDEVKPLEDRACEKRCREPVRIEAATMLVHRSYLAEEGARSNWGGVREPVALTTLDPIPRGYAPHLRHALRAPRTSIAAKTELDEALVDIAENLIATLWRQTDRALCRGVITTISARSSTA